ncbi:HEAT repeat domain-containing protein [Desulforhopalus singaporensis]|uniref:HEAT repeat-containing protein n=1 Tax=Desulforhopalus singaporensis TaxID=91360 RepID=A0A1H0M062_9BACT|nr:hypothetical protein [Desulforhopalus singaporensis]SDO73580.1 hypothetical protein SAMN05660330_00919 [Desulforhopalus singaporensis]
MKPDRAEVSDKELKRVIADFLDMGHVENIVAMFLREPRYYAWTGEILHDERLSVRLGVMVLFEELQLVDPENLHLAIASLAEVVRHGQPLYRGEAVSLLGVINTCDARYIIERALDDEDVHVREMAKLTLADMI